MKTKSMNKGLAIVLAFLLMVMAIPLTPFAMKVSAAADTYVLDVNSIEAKDYANAADTKAGTDNYFTVKWGDKGKVDTSENGKFDDGVTVTNRLNFGGKTDLSKSNRVVEFKTDGAAEVKVYWVSGGDGRQMQIYDAAKSELVTATNGASVKNSPYISKLSVKNAGTYWLAATDGTNYVFRVEVTPAAASKTYDFVADTIEAKDYANAADTKAGTDNYFTVKWGDKGKVDTSENGKFDDGVTVTNRINFGGKTDLTKSNRVVEFKTSGAAEVNLYWVSGGDGRQMQVYDAAKGEVVAATSGDSVKNSPYISKLNVAGAGTYWITATDGTNYLFKVSVTEGGSSTPIVRGDWSKVAAPVIVSAVQEADTDNIKVTVNAVVGNDGGDAVKVTMLDKDGKELETKQSTGEKDSHDLTFTASKTDTYTFKASLERDGETAKTSANLNANFTLTLKVPTIASATSVGGGKIEIEWSAVDEAESYDVFRDGTKVGNSKTTSYIDSGLTVGTKYTYTVAPVRGSDDVGRKSAEKAVTATQEAQSKWGYVVYGVSTNATDGSNGVSGDANNGSVTVFSEKGRGKIVSGGADGVTFYYTALPVSTNFTFRAKMHVDSWTYSNGQEAMGMMVSDSIPEMGTNPYWTNTYYLSVGTVAYTWDNEYNEIDYSGASGETLSRYNMRLGVGVVPKVGITPENWSKVGNDATITKMVDPGVQYTLETSAADKKMPTGVRYNIVGNVTNAASAPETYDQITDFDIEIQRNNTGYFFTYYDAKGNVVGKQKFYDRDALNALDKDNIYVGFFAARNARATFTDINLTLTDPAKDAPAEAKPADTTRARLAVKGSSVANSVNYKAEASATVDGNLTITIGGKTVGSAKLTAGVNALIPVTLPASGNNVLTYTFTPASGAAAVTTTATVKYDTYLANQKNLYVAPNGTRYGNGTASHPLDVQTAMNIAQPGQTIVVMEGTYKLTSTALVPRGNNGTKDKMIYMVADPNAKTRPVFDGQGKADTVVQIAGDYWYVKGFDVTGSNAKNGLRIAGNNCVADDITAYNNTGTGIAIQAYRDSSDPREMWPKDNLVLNCTSYNNADPGYEDADGFSAKLTVGEGNVFDGCVAYNNADDGWDLYARSSSGPIGAVTIKNSIAYGNGYLVDGTVAGNGNGFKLGGENQPGAHKLINSVAFNNKAAGITSNSGPDVKVENCTSYNNEGANITLYTNATASTDYEVKGLISFKDSTIKSGLNVPDTINAKDQDISKFNGESNYYWNGIDSANGKGDKVAANAFESLTFKGSVARNADGSVNLEGFTVLTANAPAGSGAVVKSAASQNVTVSADSDVPNPRTGFVPFAVIAIVLAGAVVAVCFIKRRRA